jgi:hypothetical protein
MNPTRSGLTILETIIALGVLVLGTFALFDAQITAQRTHERTTNMALAYQEIQAQIETVQYLPFYTIRDTFKGSTFSVWGLKTAFTSGTNRRAMCGTVSKLANGDPYNTLLGTSNPNRFLATDQSLPMRFRVDWADSSGNCAVEVIYVLTYRGI